MRGQGYDGAPNMSSQRVGVQARIIEKYPPATYIHCSGHGLNCVIAHYCAMPDEVRNVLDRPKTAACSSRSAPKGMTCLNLLSARECEKKQN